ncbi:peptidoglycan bridge formation glycyltransferase FemA/FemB family protein [Nocardioides sp. CER19]|uniref:lipid II:glycine glycyltransferase FemX n=1 Tax=Nocardioides sp. CER19 TaxID=3038538 RepID=UPI002448B59E|nr:peptidoglycan bridge formation glycyltransferase FemA/FemB family protein [Nocardioides sp. CER19]MDH2414182.1 peptidoglycan bridge formation glycyltransferase FemA/FemB family protein [Nocardioides sp. CER19]
MTLAVEPLSFEDYLTFIADRRVSFMQSPSWSAVKDRWAGERLGWRDEAGRLVGVGLLLLRRIPFVRGSIGNLADGPVIDWAGYTTEDVVDPLVLHLRNRGLVSLRLAPDQVVRRWRAATIKAAVGTGRRIDDVPPDVVDPIGARLVRDLERGGWRRPVEWDGQYGPTRHSFRIDLTGRTPEALFGAMNQQWRRGIRKAAKAGVVVERGGYDDLPDFYRVYAETARREQFPPFPPDYFQRAWRALSREAPDRIRLYLARHDGEALAGTLVTRTGGLACYAYGGSATHRREVYPSNAAHWRIMCDLLSEGVDVYDMRGVSDSLDPDDGKFGVLRFKLGTGGELVEHVSTWELVMRPIPHHTAMTAWRLRLPVVRRLESVREMRRSASGMPTGGA